MVDIVAGTVLSAQTSPNGTSHSIDATGGWTNGNLLIGVLCAGNGSAAISGIPGGWTNLDHGVSTYGQLAASLIARIVDGTEADFTATTSTTTSITRIFFEIENWYGSDIDAGSNFSKLESNASGTSKNFNQVTAPENGLENLFLAIACSASNVTYTGYPSGYTQLVSLNSGSSNGSGAFVYYKVATADNDTPSALTVSSGKVTTTYAVCVRPSGVAVAVDPITSCFPVLD